MKPGPTQHLHGPTAVVATTLAWSVVLTGVLWVLTALTWSMLAVIWRRNLVGVPTALRDTTITMLTFLAWALVLGVLHALWGQYNRVHYHRHERRQLDLVETAKVGINWS